MQSFELNIKLAIGVLAVCLAIGALTYFQFESGAGETTYVEGEIVSYTRHSSGKSAADPAFYVRLPSGVQVFVRDWGQLPNTYRGRVVLSVQEGMVSGRKIYNINAARTKELLHNK
ncbi:hypothetical protein [Spongiibacter sp. UBA1325]|uniref:hypothetical protein n=1 Tax=Spongiibacter sp. UBA1325 TaxID=1947543 RepID=UPI00257E586D|nr:hypothetical protein [Spongiibacter sp. UBA1325]|tara:strand:+ start:6350 stop:6697 length:348 start_codon:yes stop_codon:yes gene_type:complete